VNDQIWVDRDRKLLWQATASFALDSNTTKFGGWFEWKQLNPSPPSATSRKRLQKHVSQQHLQPAELRLPLVERRRSDPVAAANLRRRHASFLLLQDRNDLLFVEPASLHIVRFLGVGLYQKAVTFQGSTSDGKRVEQE